MRLLHPAIRPIGRAITLHFDGKEIPALEGETVAAALSAAGHLSFRRMPSGAPRGLYCGIGACFDCLVTIDGRAGQRACLAAAIDGMEVRSDTLSSFAPLAPFPVRFEPETLVPDVLVVGGGPAGLSAAIAAREAGAAVTLLDEREKPGGQYLKPLAASHGYTRDAPDVQFREGDALRAAAAAAGIGIETGALVWGAFAPDEITALVRGHETVFRPRRLILATGAHECPVPLPGWTLPGVMTTGALQTLARAGRVCPTEPVVIAGSGPLNFQLAAELLASGVRLAGVVEAAPRPSIAAVGEIWTLARSGPALLRTGLSHLLSLRRAGVPIFWASAITAIEGEGRPSAVRIETPAGERRVSVGLVALNAGFQPETSFARALGAAHRFVDKGLGYLATVTDEEGRTSLPTVFAVGDGAAFGGARIAVLRGRLAGLAAARDLGFPVPVDQRATHVALARAETFQRALWRIFAPSRFDPGVLPDSTVVCRCEEISAGRLRAEIALGATSPAALKRACRAGMGPCQGRFCAVVIARLCPAQPDPFGFAFPRPPVRPVAMAPLMFPGPEFEAEHIPEPMPPLLHPASPPPAPLLSPLAADVLVIGGGIVGLATAFYLAREGMDVLIAERGQDFAMAASTANAGSLHVQLLAYDFSESGPHDGGPAAATLPLGPQSIALWKEIAAEAGETLGLVTEGGLMVAEDEGGMRWLAAKVAMENRHGIASRLIGADELRAIAPALSPTLAGADFCPGEGYGDPLRGSFALRRLAEQSGARLLSCADVTALARTGATWRAETSRGPIRAGRIVNAAGPYARRVAAMAGLAVPVSGTVQQVIVTAPAQPLTRHLVLLAKRHLSLKQQANGSFLIGGGWFGDYEAATGATRPLRKNIEANLWVAGRALPSLAGLSAVRAWTGMAPEIDAAPLLGEAPGLPGFFNALAANAYTLGPIIGRLTAAAIRYGTPLDPAYTLSRFAAG
ncbi:MAG TPA: FAD-dependent oxidoreductase [Acetobacteraceae bacterium]|nr:FAD-dependent oxidoreductase [Acetobacteraceae bacterium]